jgi:hypothetical protein
MGVTIHRAFDILRRIVSSRTDGKLSEDSDDSCVNYRQLSQRKAHKPRKKEGMLLSCVAYSLTLKMETVRSSEKPVDVH